MNTSWGYNASDTSYKSSKVIIQEMVKAVSRDGNYLLNIGPKGDGTVPDRTIAILNDFGAWMNIYSESIYGTTRSPYSAEPSWGFYTKKQDKLYAHVFTWPASGILKIPSLTNIINKIYLLNDTTAMLGSQIMSDSIMITVPASAPNATNSVVVLDVVGVPSSSIQGTAVNDHLSIIAPRTFELNQNYPNPFNPSTTIRFGLPYACMAKLTVYNILGQQVALLLNKELPAGYLEVPWNAHTASGLYFYRLEATSLNNPGRRYVETKKMVLLR
jgi:hypothetical protein